MRRILCLILLALVLSVTGILVGAEVPAYDDLAVESTMALYNASQFSVEYLTGGYKRVCIGADQLFLVVPEGAAVPTDVPEAMQVLQQPLDHIYMVSSASLDYFRTLDAMDTVTLSSQKKDSWYLPEARQAMEDGSMLYAGKYSAPDYEVILSAGCDLAVENTMIFHSPEVREQLIRLGIPVLVDFSGYETDPMGRMEWIRLYGALLSKEAEADACYETVLHAVSDMTAGEGSGKTVAFFYVTSAGTISVRTAQDYVARCIGMAGASYVSFDDPSEETTLSTMTISVESFFAGAQDADILIYNSTIDGEITSLAQLIEKCPVLAKFRAVQQGNVWCLSRNFYQEPMSLGNLILDVGHISSGASEQDLVFLQRVPG